MTSPGLEVVIVSYHCRDLTRACLRSLETHPASPETRVWVVDNASSDGTAEMIRAEFPEVQIIESSRNLGFAAANNLALQGTTAPYVLVLNPDTRVTPGALDHLLELMDARPEIGIAGCRLEREDGTFDHAARRSFPTPLGALAHFTGLGRSERVPAALSQYRAPGIDSGPVDAVNGAFMLIRRAALEEVGLFDEGYWMYMEDLDLCYRFCLSGWTTWYEPAVTVVHLKGATSGPVRSSRLIYAFHYGMLRFYRKHYARRSAFVTNVVVYVGIAAKLAVSVVRSELRRVAARTIALR
jgi:N-acetylglucosaminyl-diphospho-decaprenol L-rhamnosyltransferase